MRLRHLSITAAVLVLAACGGAQDDTVPPESAPSEAAPVADIAVAGPERRILAFGDSLFAGYGLEEEEGYPEQLEDALRQGGINARVIDAGVSGDTSAAGRQRLAFTLDAQDTKPDLVLLELGGNDMLRGLSPQETRDNLDAILREAKARGIPVMLTGMLASPNMGADYAAAFNPIFPDLAHKYDAALYPFMLDGVLGDRALLLPDGIHPNARGVTVIARRLAPIVAQNLEG